MKVYESYVRDLGEQNEVLVQTVEQLEKEANDRVVNLEGKLNKAVTTAKVSWSLSSAWKSFFLCPIEGYMALRFNMPL